MLLGKVIPGFQRLSQPPCSPDLVMTDFQVFPEIKSELQFRRFGSASEFVKETIKIMSFLNKQFYIDTYDKWVSRHRKCMSTGGEYLETV